MRAYLLSRLGQTALVVFLSLTAVFGLVRLSGDPVLLFMPTDIQAKDVDEFRERLGFNDPLAVQYARSLGGAVITETIVTAVMGGLLGLVTGVVERWPSAVIVRLADVQLSFPLILLATINVIVGLGLRNTSSAFQRPDGSCMLASCAGKCSR